MTTPINLPEGFLSPIQDPEKIIAEKVSSLLSTNLAEKVVAAPVTPAEARSIRDELSSLSRSVVDVRAQLSNVNTSASTAALDAKTALDSSTSAVNQFSERLVQLEFKVSRILEALTGAGVDVDLAVRSGG